MKHYDGMEERGQMTKGKALVAKAATKVQAAEKTPEKAKDPLQTGRCNCGCGAETKGLFRPGHDAKVYAMLRKVNAGLEDVSTLDGLPPGVADRYIDSPHAQPSVPPAPKVKAVKAPGEAKTPAADTISVTCELCGATFVTTVEATEHMATAHPAKDEEEEQDEEK